MTHYALVQSGAPSGAVIDTRVVAAGMITLTHQGHND